MIAAALALLLSEVCPRLVASPGALGSTDPFKAPAPAAVTANHDGYELYRQRRWDDARQKYRAALAADPEFRGPRLNIACSLVRQERWADGAQEAASLMADAFVPWAREIREAFDLAPLRARPEFRLLREAEAAAAAKWGQGLDRALLFVARVRPAVKLLPEGVLVLSPGQEIFAWLPALGRYRQVTAEDGRVLALAPSPDGRRVAYLRGDKLVRRPGQPARLRDIGVRVLELGSMSYGPLVPIAGDVAWVELAWSRTGAATVTVAREPGVEVCVLGRSELDCAGGLGAKAGGQGTRLTGLGVQPEAVVESSASACPFTAANTRRPDGVPAIEVRAATGRLRLGGPHGAGLSGLPFPR